MQLTPSLHRLGDRLVGVYLIEEAGSVTVVDAGVPGYSTSCCASSRPWAGRSTISPRWC